MSLRGAGSLGLATTLVLALWFLPGVADSLRSGGDAAAVASHLLAALLMVRALTLVVLGWYISCEIAPRRAAVTLMAVGAMAWPLVLIAYLSSDLPALAIVGAELGLLMLASLVAFSAQALRRLPERGELRRTLALTLGIACAAVLWRTRDLYLDWLLP